MILLTLIKMKKFIITTILAALITAGTTIMAQEYPDEYLGLPGDNLNLYAVMNLFQKSQTLEDFERDLNAQNSRINNLDLNGDYLVDYITVNDYVDGNVHNIVLRVELNRNETQDVAVFTVQRFRNGSVQIQLVGDEALYGRNYIVEPIYDDYYAGRGRSGINIDVVVASPFDIARWPLIRFMYYPGYTCWNSSWHWGYYPSYWNPWRPFYWDYYYGYHYNNYPDYYRHYHRWDHNRYNRYNDFYFDRIRSHSPMVSHRIRDGHYRDTYSRPDMRREGENMYSRMHSGRNDNHAINNQGRRNDSRMSAPSASNRSISRPESVQRSTNSRKSAPSASNRSVSRPESVQRSDNSRKSAPSAPSASNRSVTRPESVQRSDYSRRSAPSASNRSVARPESGQRRETNSVSRQSTSHAKSSNQGSERNNTESGSPHSSRRK
jgi:hypothetical protein